MFNTNTNATATESQAQPKTKRDSIIALRAPVQVVTALKAAAIDDGRSMSSMALRLIQQGLKARGAQ